MPPKKSAASRHAVENPHLTEDQALLAARLVERLKLRSTAEGAIWTLDLRHKEFGRLGRITLYRPGMLKWPNSGSTTSDKKVATAWIYADGGYAQWLSRQWSAAVGGDLSIVTVEQAAKNYLRWLAKEHGDHHNTTVNRRTTINRHIVPALGHQPLHALNRRNVRAFLEKLMIQKRVGNERLLVPAAPKTRENVRAALLAIWAHTDKDAPCPFMGIGLRAPSDGRDRRDAIIAGDVDDLSPDRTLTMEEFEMVLLTAMWYDEHILLRPCQRATFVPLTVDVIVALYATAMRISELARFQWRHLLESQRGLKIPGTKTDNALRPAPLQRAWLPWIVQLQQQARKRSLLGGKHHVFAMHTRRTNGEGRTTDQLIERIDKVLYLAGCKLPQQSTHIFRRMHFTLAAQREKLVDTKSVKVYLGHEKVYEGSSDRYFDTRNWDNFFAQMPKSHRAYIELPTPAQLRRKLKG
ncbi:MAG: site-specific integrase, partial [Gemmatimonas sp.]